jgi:hypothetical protein
VKELDFESFHHPKQDSLTPKLLNETFFTRNSQHNEIELKCHSLIPPNSSKMSFSFDSPSSHLFFYHYESKHHQESRLIQLLMLEHELQIKAILEKLNHVELDGDEKRHNAQEMAESCNNND